MQTKETARAPIARPLPVLDDENKPFWEAARRGQLQMQRCGDCAHVRYPISAICPKCLSARSEWIVLSGRGSVYSTIVFHQIYHQAFASEVPYNVSLIQLEEGPRMFSNVTGVPPGEVKVGDAVEVIFETLTENIALPRFRPLDSSTASSGKESA